MPSSIAGPVETDKLKGDRLFKHMKGRKKRAAKRARSESPPAPTPEPKLSPSPTSEPELPGAPPIIDLEESIPLREPENSAEPAMRAAAEPEANSVVHALALQSEWNLKRALTVEESSRAAHTDLRDKDELACEKDVLRGEAEALKAELACEKGALRDELDAVRAEAEGLKENKKALLHEVEFLKADIKEKTEIFIQAVEETKIKAVAEYIQSDKFDVVLGEAYRKGFKINRWLIRHTYPELDTSAITTSRITDEIARQAREDPDSEEEDGDEEVDAPDQLEAPEEVSRGDEESPK
ncbi:PREDICTED: MAP7 domain-containing protein 1-like [Nelumbo nucifera]|uniref:MAP7 domain-containing protein 1-like n=1 Tax=Nelumbo nucifera TaxID=4432 RepID=A0A1U8ARU2_NELNU|nr:PREDICTED: MAP7 domain-containing protein 1-like [Nelumbo nucifera]